MQVFQFKVATLNAMNLGAGYRYSCDIQYWLLMMHSELNSQLNYLLLLFNEPCKFIH